MAERPILFSAPMIRALLAGTKTQTRRVVKPLPEPRGHNGGAFMDIVPSLLPNRGGLFDVRYALDNPRAIRCPYGQPGDQLWVREAFCDDWADTLGVQYRADGGLDMDMFDAGCKWRPSIHMPRWASRITLEITGVRVERLQDISEADAMAEGIDEARLAMYLDKGSTKPAMRAYLDLWDEINGDGSWAANPWVWAVSFKRAASKEGA